ncbi:D-glycero-beta-D-manno-heptose 1-phosphate adenylyltransferase [Candidatus Desantisbacteria bacterium]|nr:D-glycero-beta-D-manno-heptose 1-phosphate adenylyltransferase [Candidatus Desantisbacteria bacterium]
MKKIFPLDKLKKIINKYKQEGKKIVFTNGCFDILHTGHLAYLEKARKLGDILIVGLNSDSSIHKIKGPERPLNSQKDRAYALSSLFFVDYVVIFNEENPIKLISILLPDILVKGSDYKKKDILGGDIVRCNGGRVVTVKLVRGYSTTGFIKTIIERFSHE